MATQTVTADWIRDQDFLLSDHFGFSIPMAQPAGVNGADLLPMSVVGCAAWDVVSMLKKQRQPVTALQVIAESEREEAPPWRFRKIHVHYRISGPNLNEDSIRRAIELTEQKYCSTFATLRKAVEITSTYEIVEEQEQDMLTGQGEDL